LCALDTDKPNQACDTHRALKRHRMLCSALTCAAHSLNVIESLRASFHNTPVECFICLKSLDSLFIQSIANFSMVALCCFTSHGQ